MNRPRPADLRAAIEGNALSLHFQVQVHVPTGRLSGVESFVRWPHPVQGLLGPADILPLVEEGLLYTVFDRWVLRELCDQVVRWRTSRVPVPLVAANIWPQTLRHPDFAGMVAEVLASSGAEPPMLEIELPRGALADSLLVAKVAEIRRMGVRMATDDVARAAHEPLPAVDTFKLRPGTSTAVVDGVVGRARELVARVVAEGVETSDERDALVSAGCEVVQGYVYGPEVSAADVHTLAGS